MHVQRIAAIETSSPSTGSTRIMSVECVAWIGEDVSWLWTTRASTSASYPFAGGPEKDIRCLVLHSGHYTRLRGRSA